MPIALRALTIAILCALAFVFPAILASSAKADSAERMAPAIADLHALLMRASNNGESVRSETCLACHGPFEALQELTRDYVAPNGVPVNPHITFDMTMPANPHSSGEGVIECTECHESHAIPLTEPMPAANIDMCVECHHTGMFRACSDCH